MSRLFFAYLLINPLAVFSATTGPAGEVVAIQGTAEVVTKNGTHRQLHQGIEVFEGDTLITGNGAQLRIRMMDNAMLTLATDSRLLIEAYQWDGPGRDADRAALTLHHGRVQAITGDISESSGNAYELNTPFGTIATAGANYECAQLAELYCGINSGNLNFTNSAGSLALGREADFDYLEVTGAAYRPAGLLYQPPLLQNLHTLPQSGAFTLNQQQAVDMPASPATSANRALPAQANPAFPSPTPITVTPVKK